MTIRDQAAASPGAFFDALEVEGDEVMIVTLLAERDDDERLILRHGTAVFAPSECGQVSWGVWASHQARNVMALCPDTAPGAFVHDGGTWVAVRAVLALDRACQWLTVLRDGATADHVRWPASDGLPAFEVQVREPTSLIRILPGTDTPASSFLASAKRPAMGTLWAGAERPALLLPNMVNHDGSWYDPVLCLLGMLVPSEGVPQAVPPPLFGLFVGRLERRAWLSDLAGDGPAFEALQVYVGWDPSRIDLTNLVIDLEQFVDGELVNQLRAPLEDTSISDEVRQAGAYITSLPTFGRGTASRVSLTTREGALLDRIGPHHLVESIHIGMTTNGHEQPPIVIGNQSPPPGLEERAARQQQVAEQVAGLASQGAEARQLVDRVAAEERLKLEISSARGQLLVHDPFFGQDPDDWRLLDDVAVPVRVLTAKIAKDSTPTIAGHVQARYRPKAPMHDRVCIWRDGGFSLGGSPTTFGQSPVWIRRVSAADSDVMRSVFEACGCQRTSATSRDGCDRELRGGLSRHPLCRPTGSEPAASASGSG